MKKLFPEKSIDLEIVNVQQQIGSNDCGFFALAFVTILCEGETSFTNLYSHIVKLTRKTFGGGFPEKTVYHQNQMRTHFKRCLVEERVSNFPASVKDIKNRDT